MKQSIAEILGKLLAIGQSNKVTLRVILLIVAIGATYAITISTVSKAKQKPCEDCTVFKTQNSQLIQALIDIKKSVQEVAQNTYYQMDELPLTVMYASLDSIPKKKRPPSQQQIKLGLIVNRIDSMLLKMQQQQVQIKH